MQAVELIENMDVVAVVISFLAFFLSALSFWWVSLRAVYRIALIPLQSMNNDFDFVLVNGGTKEVLITDYWFNVRSARQVDPQFSYSSFIRYGEKALLSVGGYRRESGQLKQELMQSLDELAAEDREVGEMVNEAIISISVAWVDGRGRSWNSTNDFLMVTRHGKGVVSTRPLLKGSTDLYKRAEESEFVP